MKCVEGLNEKRGRRDLRLSVQGKEDEGGKARQMSRCLCVWEGVGELTSNQGNKEHTTGNGKERGGTESYMKVAACVVCVCGRGSEGERRTSEGEGGEVRGRTGRRGREGRKRGDDNN